MEALGNGPIIRLFLRQRCLKIEWPTFRGSELLVIRDVQTRTTMRNQGSGQMPFKTSSNRESL